MATRLLSVTGNVLRTRHVLIPSNFSKRLGFMPCAALSSQAAQPKTDYSAIKRLLIANRGEIACRIMRTAKKLGIQTVAVYSEADKNSLHVDMADEAHCIGPPESQRSYLNYDKILSVIRSTSSNAVHPGYGFLSENTEFAELCQTNDVIFVGPPSQAIRDMGIKSTSKRIMSEANVPIIEGYHGEDQSDEILLREAEKIKFPVMIKAVRGGGGKGMRIALNRSEFNSQLQSARNEALKSFNDDVMLIEKFVINPRHVEVQVFGDQYGNYVYLFERDCSVQRRHQKIIEEAPAPHLSDAVRREIGEAAVRAARAVNYVGAGTVEFVMDSEQKFYFMEMNTRLQVEHPVSEMITGTDLVEWQLRVAAGERLPLLQDDLQIRGHSFEARIYAEDPNNAFMPGAGPLEHLLPPDDLPYIRVETGVRQGDEVSVYYDPMIAKLVVWGEDRHTALSRLITALQQYQVVGLNTNINFLLSLSRHAEFQKGNVHTEFIPQHNQTLFPKSSVSSDSLYIAALTHLKYLELSSLDETTEVLNYRPNFNKENKITFKHDDTEHVVSITHCTDHSYKMLTDGSESAEVIGEIEVSNTGRMGTVCEIDGRKYKCDCLVHNNSVNLFNQSGRVEFTIPEPKYKTSSSAASSGSDAVAPMPGVIDKVFVKPGDEVEEGQPIIVMIAMKMEYTIRAPRSGVVEKIPYSQGTTVTKGSLLVHLQEEKES